MPAEKLVLGNVIDGDGLMALSDVVSTTNSLPG
jgi:hypothetical protein